MMGQLIAYSGATESLPHDHARHSLCATWVELLGDALNNPWTAKQCLHRAFAISAGGDASRNSKPANKLANLRQQIEQLSTHVHAADKDIMELEGPDAVKAEQETARAMEQEAHGMCLHKSVTCVKSCITFMRICIHHDE